MKFSIRSLILLGCVAISCQSSINCVPEKQDAFCLASNNGTKEELLKVFLDYTSIWTNLINIVERSPKQIICNVDSLGYQIWQMAALANDLVEEGNFSQYKQVYGIDVPLAQCALKNITKVQIKEFERSCAKNCNVQSAKKKLLSYSNSIFIDLVNKIFEEDIKSKTKFRPYTICAFQAVNNMMKTVEEIAYKKSAAEFCIAVKSVLLVTASP